MDKCLVGIDNLFQVDGGIAVVGEGGVTVEVLVSLDDIFYWCWCLDYGSTEDAAGEVTAIGDEVDVCIEVTLYLLEALANLGNVLVLEGLVDAQVVVTPREMGVAPGF